MENNNMLPLIWQIREQLRKEKNEYLRAVENGRSIKAKGVAERITSLQNELDELQPHRKDGYQSL